MKILHFIICFLFFYQLCGQQASLIWKISTDTIETYVPYFNDEFQGNNLNKSKWLDRYQWGGLDFKTRMYSAPEMTYVSNGFLTLGADTTTKWFEFPDWVLDSVQIRKNKIELRDNTMQLSYLTSVIFSKDKFKYGYFECKAKAPSGQGLWPAFWLYGGEPNEEIDFMEMKGEKHNKMHVDVHCPNKCKYIKMRYLPFISQRWGGWLKFNKDLVGNWVIYSGLWEPGKVTFYVNGEVVAEYQGDFKTAMHLIANLSIAVDNGPFKPGINKKTVLPNSFEIDYIRVWKNERDTTLKQMIKKNDFGKEERKIFKPIQQTKLKTHKKVMLRCKSLKKELGYVTIMPLSNHELQVSKNGSHIGPIEVEILSIDKQTILSKSINSQSDVIETSTLKKGNYLIQLKHQGITKVSDFQIR